MNLVAVSLLSFLTKKCYLMTKVFIIESEVGWGQKVDSTLEFSTKEEAEAYCREYNNKHNPIMDKTPDWYMYAKMDGQEYGMLRSKKCQD